jgi:hypothetical protein
MNTKVRIAPERSSRAENLRNWLALLTLLALGIVLPGTQARPAAPRQDAGVTYVGPLSP